MPEQITGNQYLFIHCGTLFVGGIVTFLIAWRQLKRDKLLPYDEE